jgi:hypothetical protein
MKLTSVQDQAIAARLALVVGAATFDRVFASVSFDEVDGDMLYVYSNADNCPEIANDYGLRIMTIATELLGRQVNSIMVFPMHFAE